MSKEEETQNYVEQKHVGVCEVAIDCVLFAQWAGFGIYTTASGVYGKV